MSTISDIAFEDAHDVGSIRYRLHPIDVGWDLRGEGVAVAVDASDDPLRVSYADRSGERRVMAGSQRAVVARLRRLGYSVEVSRG